MNEDQVKLNIKEYFTVDDDGTAILDGDFTSEELRRIADEVDKKKI